MHIYGDFPGGSEVKASACNAGDLGWIPGSGRLPWRRKGQPTPVLLPGESHGRRSLVGYSPGGQKESDTTEQLHFHFHALEKEMVTHSSVLPGESQGREPSGLPSMGSNRVGHD